MPAVVRNSLAFLAACVLLALVGVGPARAAALAGAAAWLTIWLRRAPEVIRREVRAVRVDPDFGRLGLFGDRVWRGTVELPGLRRPLDLEIEAEGDGPTLAHRLALRDVRRRWRGLERVIDEVLRAEAAGATPSYLTLRLPEEARFVEEDWSVAGLMSETDGGREFQVRVRDGGVVGVELAA